MRVGNDGAQELYRSFGFAPAGMRKRYYEDTDDAIVMWAHDIGSRPTAPASSGSSEAIDPVRPMGGCT